MTTVHPVDIQPGQPMEYHQPIGVAQPGGTTVIVQQPPSKPSSYLALAIFVTICCNLPLGIIAIIFSVLSSSAADNGELDSARTKGKVSMGLSIAGILLTIIIVVVVVVYFTVIVASAVNAVSQAVG